MKVDSLGRRVLDSTKTTHQLICILSEDGNTIYMSPSLHNTHHFSLCTLERASQFKRSLGT